MAKTELQKQLELRAAANRAALTRRIQNQQTIERGIAKASSGQ